MEIYQNYYFAHIWLNNKLYLAFIKKKNRFISHTTSPPISPLHRRLFLRETKPNRNHLLSLPSLLSIKTILQTVPNQRFRDKSRKTKKKERKGKIARLFHFEKPRRNRGEKRRGGGEIRRKFISEA